MPADTETLVFRFGMCLGVVVGIFASYICALIWVLTDNLYRKDDDTKSEEKSKTDDADWWKEDRDSDTL